MKQELLELSEDLAMEQKLLEFCREFIKQQQISCAEAIVQTDRVYLALPELAEGICDIVGYYDYDTGEVRDGPAAD